MSKDNLSDFFYSGTSGLAIPFNKTQYPAEFKDKSQLQYYASQFNSIEINSSFYKLPKTATVKNWAESVPKDFRFTLKVPKSITHSPELDAAPHQLTEFMQVISQVGDKKGCLLAQFPPSLTIEKIEPFTQLLKQFNQEIKLSSWKLAVEFRHSSWYDPSVYQLLKTYNASLVLHDMKNSTTQWSNVYDEIIYVRLHGPEPRYRGNYSDESLKQIAEAVINWINEGKTVYTYFNNTVGAAFNNVKTLNEFVQELRP